MGVSKYDAKERWERQEPIRVHILRVAKQLIAGRLGVIEASREFLNGQLLVQEQLRTYRRLHPNFRIADITGQSVPVFLASRV